MTEDAEPRFEVIEMQTRYKGYFQIDLYRFRHKRFDGSWSGVIEREVFERGHAAAVLPYDPERDQVVLIEQFRAGALAADQEPWQQEVIAGIIDPGETAAEVVRREAVEEAGCHLQDLETIGTYFVSPGGCSETVALFCARVDADGLGGLHGLAEEDEDIRVRVVSSDRALEELAAGTFANATAVLCLQWFALNRERLRRTWT